MNFTYVSSYYDQPHLAELWWHNLSEWDQELAERIDFVFVDDGSPKSPLEVPESIRKRFKVRHFRIDVDIPWNEMGARNLGMKHVNGWALLMDADFVLRADMAHKILALEDLNKRDRYHPFARIWKQTEIWSEVCNLYLMHSESYWSNGGYPEQYAGHYGCSDMEFFHNCNQNGVKAHKWKHILIDHFPNGHVSWIDRNLQHNSDLLNARLHAGRRKEKNLILNFPWREVTCV